MIMLLPLETTRNTQFTSLRCISQKAILLFYEEKLPNKHCLLSDKKILITNLSAYRQELNTETQTHKPLFLQNYNSNFLALN